MAGEGVSFRSFVSETELDEKRKKRQEEWDKVRTADQPLECPEEEHDPRSLFEKLQQQKEVKQSDFEEQFKFKNMVRGIDEDESKFLDEVSDRQMEIESRRWREEKEMLEEMKQYTERVIPADEAKDKPTNTMWPGTERAVTAKAGSAARKTQASLLAGVVKRKRSGTDDNNGEKRVKTASPPNSSNSDSPSQRLPDCPPGAPSNTQSPPAGAPPAAVSDTVDRPLLDASDKARVVSILPGLGFYSNSSDSDTSSSDSEVDLLNSVIHRHSKKKGHAACN